MAETKKQAFDKIRSAIERRRLFENALQEKSVFLCKFGEDEELVQIAASAFQDDVLVGRAEAPIALQNEQSALGNFAVGLDRYFFNGKVDIRGRYVSIPATVEVFKLERRKTLRVSVPPGYALSANVTDINGKAVFQAVQVIDISAGGLRLFFPENPAGVGLQGGSLLKGVLHLPSTRTLAFDGVIRHVQAVPTGDPAGSHFGLEFGQCQSHLAQRMTVLTFDIQRKLTSGY